MNPNKVRLVVVILLILLIELAFVRFILGGDEDTWIKDENGVWVKHGNPSKTPQEVLEQQEMFNEAE